jgi:hypothetical protein
MYFFEVYDHGVKVLWPSEHRLVLEVSAQKT